MQKAINVHYRVLWAADTVGSMKREKMEWEWKIWSKLVSPLERIDMRESQ